ncbi:MAG: hypothetical protein Q4G41_03475 [Coriobacteriales bacterium]|nr:hypothetical protein [Coriobacteriales bacterium]MDO5709156.1 hypothetical protein [Coriobacteriales bacterium]
MRLVVGSTLSGVYDAALDKGLSLKGPLTWRDAACGLRLPAHVVDRYRDKSSLSIWRWPIPDGAYELLKDGSRICTPEFTYLLMARLLSDEELALFGLEICGTYAIDKKDKKGFVSGTTPQTNVKRLEAFLGGCSGAPGSVRAKRVLRWVVDKSASPMESMLVLLLCLPRRMGGFGLPMPELNVSVNELRGLRDVDRGPFVDLLWRLARFSLEYDSDLEHTGKDRISRDSIRRVLLEELKIRSFSVTSEQVNDSVELARIARITSKALGVKYHSVGLELRRRNASLRQRLYEFTRCDEQQ